MLYSELVMSPIIKSFTIVDQEGKVLKFYRTAALSPTDLNESRRQFSSPWPVKGDYEQTQFPFSKNLLIQTTQQKISNFRTHEQKVTHYIPSLKAPNSNLTETEKKISLLVPNEHESINHMLLHAVSLPVLLRNMFIHVFSMVHLEMRDQWESPNYS